MDQTKTLHSCHKNIGLAMADLIEACDQMHHVVNLQRSLESEELQRDWDKFFPCLEQFTAALSYVRAHPTLRSQRDLVAAAEDVRALAIDESTQGVSHPIVAIRLNNLAELFRDMGRLEEPEIATAGLAC